MNGINSSGFLSKRDHYLVRHHPICQNVDNSIAAELCRISHFRNYSEGKTVVAEGDEVGIIGNVVSGVLKLVKSLLDGRQHIVGLVHPPGMFGRIFGSRAGFAIEAATE